MTAFRFPAWIVLGCVWLASRGVAQNTAPGSAVGGLSGERLLAIREGFDQRTTAIFAAEKGRALVRSEPKPPLGAGRLRLCAAIPLPS